VSVGEISYESAVGFALNCERTETREIWKIATAVAVANGNYEVPDEWSNHLTDSPEDALVFRRLLRQQRMNRRIAESQALNLPV
jgi:hypothetical protein